MTACGLQRRHPAGAVEVTTRASLQVREGRFFLLRRGSDLCAVRTLAGPNGRGCSLNGPSGLRYEWYRAAAGASDFRHATHGRGGVRERYTPVEGGVYSTEGSALDIRCGAISIWWSAGALDYSYVYFDDQHGGPPPGVEWAVTSARSVDGLDAHDPTLQWYAYREPAP